MSTSLASILILAGAVFYFGAGKGTGGPASLFDAYDLLKRIVGQGGQSTASSYGSDSYL